MLALNFSPAAAVTQNSLRTTSYSIRRYGGLLFLCIQIFFFNTNALKERSHITKFSPLFLPPATKLWQGNIFTPVCHSVHRGGAYVAGGVHGRGHPWQGACVAGGVHGRGHVWHAPPTRYYKIRSMSRQYASYWNAFLLLKYRSVILSIMGDKPIQSIIQPVTIDTMLNWVADRYLNIRLDLVMCEQGLKLVTYAILGTHPWAHSRCTLHWI